MHHDVVPLLTVAVALAAGVAAQVLAHAWRLPAIVLLLVLGVVLGPEGVGWVQPGSLGDGLGVIVKLCVAVILFEGAFVLRLRALRDTAREVRGLVTVGVVVTGVLTSLAARYVAGLPWTLAVLFGTLMTVTGPTVVQPLMRRVHVPRRLKTVLEGEAILIDPVGAILAVAVLDVVLGLLGDRGIGVAGAVWAYVGRLLVGAVVGAAGGWGLARLLRGHVVPRELVNLVVLAGVWLVFGLAELALSEAGIMAVVAMGLVFQHAAPPGARTLRRFKEQLTTLGISLLFILLAANLPLAALWDERGRGLLTVLLLMFVIRPLAVFASTVGSALTVKERLFVAWIGPRGIVAASVASLFAVALTDLGLTDGGRVLGLTFLTIALTVVVQGLTAPLVARALGLQSLERRRAVVVGAGPLGVAVAAALQAHGRAAVVVDRNAALVDGARAAGIDGVVGDALDEAVLEQAGIDEAETLVAATANEEVNLLAVQTAHEAFGVERAYPVLQRTGPARAFGRAVSVRRWEADPSRPLALVGWDVPDAWAAADADRLPDGVLPLVRLRAGSPEVVADGQAWAPGDRIVFAALGPEGEAQARLDALVPAKTSA